MLLADHAQVADGKLYVNGAGWTITGPDPTPFAIALIFEVDWDRTNEQLTFSLDLVDADGHPVMAHTEDGERPAQLSGQFEVGRPAGLKRGTPINFPVAINVGPQPIPPGGRYEWRLTFDDESREDWRLPFSTRPSTG